MYTKIYKQDNITIGECGQMLVKAGICQTDSLRRRPQTASSLALFLNANRRRVARDLEDYERNMQEMSGDEQVDVGMPEEEGDTRKEALKRERREV